MPDTPETLPTMPTSGSDNYKESTTRIKVVLVEVAHPEAKGIPINNKAIIGAALLDTLLANAQEPLKNIEEVRTNQKDIEIVMNTLNSGDSDSRTRAQSYAPLYDILATDVSAITADADPHIKNLNEARKSINEMYKTTFKMIAALPTEEAQQEKAGSMEIQSQFNTWKTKLETLNTGVKRTAKRARDMDLTERQEGLESAMSPRKKRDTDSTKQMDSTPTQHR